MLVLPQKYVSNAKRDTIWKGEGPSYMKVPYTYPPFQVISSHHCTVFGVGVFRIGRGCKNVFICVCMSVGMCVLSRSSKTLYGAPEGEGVNGKFSILVFKDFGVGAEFGQKNEVYMLSGNGRKWCQKFGGHTKIHFSSYFYYYY